MSHPSAFFSLFFLRENGGEDWGVRQGRALPRGERGGGILLEPPEAALLIFPFPPSRFVGFLDRSVCMSSLTPAERRAEFRFKDAFLGARFSPIAPAAFYSDYLFRDMSAEFRPSIILYEEHPGEVRSWKRKAVPVDELMDYADRDDVAVNPCAYWHDYPRKQLMRRVFSFVMDIDDVRPKTLQYLVDIIERGEFPRPTAITNSGSGIHFFYILREALEVGSRDKYLSNFQLAEQIYFILHQRLKNMYRGVQKHHLGQDYRMVGSLTKFGDVSTAWECGDFWDVLELADALQIDVERYYAPALTVSTKMRSYAVSIAGDLGIEPPPMEIPARPDLGFDGDDTRIADARWRSEAAAVVRGVYDFIAVHKDAAYQVRQLRRAQSCKRNPNKGKGWYEDTWRRVYTQTQAGNRFNAMRGLAIVAYKCGIPGERFALDLERLSELWQEQKWDGDDSFNPKNTEAILRMFANGERYKMTTRSRLEELFGWKWPGQRRRINGRSQSEHLKRARALQAVDYPEGEWRNKRGAPTAQSRVEEWRKEHPDGKKAECIRETGLSKPTVYKWWDFSAQVESGKKI